VENFQKETSGLQKGLEQIQKVYKDSDPKQRGRRVYDGAYGRKLTDKELEELKFAKEKKKQQKKYSKQIRKGYDWKKRNTNETYFRR
jgi:hypothetical protein